MDTKVLKIDVTSLEIGDDDILIDKVNNNRYFDYNETFATSVILPPKSDYRTITFNEVTSSFMLVFTADQPCNVIVDDKTITNTQFIVLNCNVNSLQVANTANEKEAQIKVYIWGIQ